MLQNRDKKNQFIELRSFREANTAVAIEIPTQTETKETYYKFYGGEF